MKIRKIIFCALLFAFWGTAARADETTQAFLDGVRYYKAGEFSSAATAFGRVADAGVRNGKLFYNLGNAFLKNGDLGHALLWYERALRLRPDDPDLKFNYAYARSLTKDAGGGKAGPIVRILFFWRYLLSPDTIRWIAIGLNLIFWGIAAVRLVQRKKVLKAYGAVCLTLALIFTLTACYNDYERTHFRAGVILSEKAPVRSGLSEDATELFVLHAGSRVRIDREKGDFFRIYFSEGKIGWVEKDRIGVI
ncbi:hypothetical protein DENIS_1043 [Desulfonema ishimotonii]|uniref:Uncharacterized protein n=1 Tax=Desulfonema ishimotonii TaxID=45657 RepID=A0A401FT01_9BACT|nr:tetratricopeptide repeat protein [Desulfonema ishimotonii]GBC60099.1 hypothetical protein DENIS_1043 [Desulfonema ishimotonii]